MGLVVVCIEPHLLRVQMTGNYDRVRKLFAVDRLELKNLKLATHGLQSRIENSLDEFPTMESFAAFVGTRANDLRLTEPRLVKLVEMDADFNRLFVELVEDQTAKGVAQHSPAEVLPPQLGEVFYRLSAARKIWSPGKIMVPVYNRKLDIPYAYKNGVVNLVKPHQFPASKHAETQAATLAINGDLIRRHLIDGEQHRLIVVSTQETPEQSREVTEHIEPLFKEYGVRLIRPESAAEFAAEVERSAHN